MYSAAIKRRVLDMACHGVSYYEIERTLGVSHATVSKWARAAGIKRGKGGGCVAKANAERNAEALEWTRSALAGKFDVLSLDAGRHARLRCCACGAEFSRHVDLRYPTTCPECAKREAEANAKRRADEYERERKRAVMQDLVNILAYEHTCPVCGRKFRHSNPHKVYCTARCAQHHKSNGDSVKRAKKNGAEYDCSISLDKLIDRDGLACYLCGKTCTKEDKRWGTFGPDYPTIDHVIPLSKGGSHTWDNVKVACGECNCVVKGAKVLAS